ncbi:MAG: hypothetical protein GY854_35135, partial [Deltaproteobacteria bacterium]|nr:hypothetical protein [Deltaproteobacteria bacterium]
DIETRKIGTYILDKDSYLWARIGKDLYKGNEIEGFKRVELPEENVRNLQIGKQGNIWIVGKNNVYRTFPPAERLKWKHMKCTIDKKRQRREAEDEKARIMLPGIMKDN